MSKTIIFLLSAVFIFAVSNETKVFATVDVTSLVLDKTVAYLPCSLGASSSGGCDDDTKVKVSAETTGANNGVAIFRYTVTGGKIVGTGANVYWDLSGVRPGTYTITAAAADDGFGFNGETKTATISVAECPDCGGDACMDCPVLSVSASKKEIKSGETVVFTADARGGSQDKINYKWTVEGGTIVEGDNTWEIKVSPFKKSKKVKATVVINTICDEVCGIASASAESRIMQIY